MRTHKFSDNNGATTVCLVFSLLMMWPCLDQYGLAAGQVDA